jgi:hypothetical protein
MSALRDRTRDLADRLAPARERARQVAASSAAGFHRLAARLRRPATTGTLQAATTRDGSGVSAIARRAPLARRHLAILVLGVLLLCSAASALTAVVAYAHYAPLLRQDRALASDGLSHLHTAGSALKSLSASPFNSAAISQAKGQLESALADFNHLNGDLGQVPPGATLVPHYGALLSGAEHVLPLAITATDAGIEGCTLLSLVESRMHDPLSTTGTGLTSADLATLSAGLRQLQHLFDNAQAEMAQIQPSDLQLDARLGPALATARADLPTISSILSEARAFLAVAPQVLGIGTPTNYLVEMLDSTEIRPGGGFVGNYGTATVSGARLQDLHITDTYLLDDAYQNAGNSIPYPPAYSWFRLASSWSLRDSNLDADFPTAARYAEQIYHTEGGTVPVSGVLALTPYVIEDLLQLTGPIAVPEYGETVTAQNLIDRIHYHQEGPGAASEGIPSPDGHSSTRKRFTELLFEHFFTRVRALAPTDAAAFARVLWNAVRSHDIQIYFNNAQAEQLLAHYQLASTIQAPAGDSLFVVDANVAANKANNFMTYTLDDTVTLAANGTATHTTTLTYSWPDTPASEQNNLYGTTYIYSDYLRLYVPPGSTLLAQSGWQPEGTSQAFGRDVWAGLMTLPFGQTQTVSLRWSTPQAAAHDASSWHYRFFVQRQAGITWNMRLQVALPSCAHNVSHAVGLTLAAGAVASARTAIGQDTTFALDYAC